MRLIIGLGNIGPQFAGTRHNVGFESVDIIATNHNAIWQAKDRFKADMAEVRLHGHKVLLIKPNTYYNLSGNAVRALKDFYKLPNNDILVIHDELALPFGTLRARTVGRDAGNKGIKSVIATIGPEFARIRVGIANQYLPKQDPSDFVIRKFTPKERQKLPTIQTEIQRLVDDFILQEPTPHRTVSTN